MLTDAARHTLAFAASKQDRAALEGNGLVAPKEI